MSEPIYVAIEGGGTKFICAVGHAADRVLQRTVIPTRDPATTMAAVLEFIAAATAQYGRLNSIGIASFGPLDLRPNSPSFGRLLATPKPGWSHTDLIGPVIERFDVPVRIDMDVAAAARAELELGAARDVASVAYITVGTGIGGGFAPSGPSGATLLHPEVGHLLVRRHPNDLEFPGVCPFHRDCLEGLASGPAVRARWQQDLGTLDPTHPAPKILGHYLGQLAAAITLIASPQRIAFGGGVMTDGRVLPHLRVSARECLNGYVAPLDTVDAFERYIVGSGLDGEAGLAGAFLLAAEARTPRQ